MSARLPQHLRVTNAGWSETDCAWKVQLGDSEQTIAYVWLPGGVGVTGQFDHAMKIATRICEGWNS